MELFISIILYLGTLPLIILLFKKKAFDLKEPIVPFIWVTAIASVYEIVGTGFLQINTSYWFQIYSFLEIISLYYFFSKLFKERYKTVINIFFIFLLVVYSCSLFLWKDNGSLQAHSINKSSLTFSVLIACFFWFRDLFKNVEVEENLWNLPTFYFISAVILYYSSTLLLFSLGNIIFSDIYLYDYWWINVFATLILRILLTIGTWKIKFK